MGVTRRYWEDGSEDAGTTDGRDGNRPPGPVPPRGFVMEAVLIFGLLLLLALLAARFGHDSREHLTSAEEALARQGFTWSGGRK